MCAITKGKKRVIEALKTVGKELNISISYTVIGDAIDNTKLDSEVLSDNGLKINIIRHLSVNKEELVKHYSNCDVFVLPSINEGFGIVFIEAMRFGVPVIGPERQGPGEFIVDGRNGFVVNPVDTRDIADKLILCRNTVWDIKYIKRSVEKFSWKNVSDKTLKVYRQVVDNYR